MKINVWSKSKSIFVKQMSVGINRSKIFFDDHKSNFNSTHPLDFLQ